MRPFNENSIYARIEKDKEYRNKVLEANKHQSCRPTSNLVFVSDKPSPPLGPAETTESSATCVEFRWRPPKDDGGSPVSHYVMERQQVGRNTWKKMGEIPGAPTYRDTDVDHGRKYCYRIWAVTAEGTSEMMETDEMQAGTLGESHQASVHHRFHQCILKPSCMNTSTFQLLI